MSHEGSEITLTVILCKYSRQSVLQLTAARDQHNTILNVSFADALFARALVQPPRSQVAPNHTRGSSRFPLTPRRGHLRQVPTVWPEPFRCFTNIPLNSGAEFSESTLNSARQALNFSISCGPGAYLYGTSMGPLSSMAPL